MSKSIFFDGNNEENKDNPRRHMQSSPSTSDILILGRSHYKEKGVFVWEASGENLCVIKSEMKAEAGNLSSTWRAVVPPPQPPPLPRKRTAETESVTNREIARYWRQRRIEEEDHLLAAIKAAARIRARKLSGDEYRQFVESLEEADRETEATSRGTTPKADDSNEARLIIMDWWTKSKYAYLNQPAIGSAETPRRRITDYNNKSSNNYTPNCFTFKPAPTILGVF